MSGALERKMEALRVKFRDALPDRLGEASAIVSRISHPGSDGIEDTKAAHRLIHELSGSAGFLGDAAIALELREALVILEGAGAHDRQITVDEAGRIQNHVRNAVELCETTRPKSSDT